MGELRRVIEEDIQVAKEIVPRFRKCMKLGNNILAILGAIIGGLLGYLAFFWIARRASTVLFCRVASRGLAQGC